MLSTLIKRHRTLFTSTLLSGMLMLAGTAQAMISYSQYIDFGGLLYPGGSGQKVINITKADNISQVNITTVMDSGDLSDFSFSGGSTSLTDVAPSTTLTINFHPTTTGPRSAVLRITANNPEDPGYSPDFYVWLTGAAGDRSIEVRNLYASVITPGDTTPSTSDGTDLGMRTSVSGQTLFIHKTGYADVTISSVTVTGTDAGDFSAYATTGVMTSGSATLDIGFNPSPKAYATRTATVTINSNATAYPAYSFAIQATAGSAIAVQGGGVNIADGDTTPSLTDETDFDVAMISGEQVVSTYTIKNTGISPLSVSSIIKSGTHSSDFTVGGITLPATIGASSSQTFTVTFDPSASGTRTATIAINSDATNGPAVYDFAVRGRGANPADLNATWDPYANNEVHATVEQPDGKTVIGGAFTTVDSASHIRLVRINTDGSVDSGFGASASWPSGTAFVVALVVQPDGKILVGGDFTQVNGVGHVRLARLNSDGSLDTGFNPTVSNGVVNAICLQPDGKILIGGDFTAVTGTSKARLARLNSDGTLDTSFTASANDMVRSIVLQPDGKVVVSGLFTSVNSTTKNRIARLDSTGALDTGFTASANNTPLALALQPDGKIVMGGTFTSVNSTGCARLARLNSDGTLDTSFTSNATANSNVYGLTLQADGKILVCGYLSQLNSTATGYCGRLNSNGTLDSTFDAGANTYVFSSHLKADGRVVIGGEFTTVQSTARGRIALLENNAATESLTITSGLTRIEWLRGGSSPEASRVTFELSTNGGVTWTSLGSGTRISGGWELTGLSLSTGKIRARAYTPCGKLGASAGLVETILDF